MLFKLFWYNVFVLLKIKITQFADGFHLKFANKLGFYEHFSHFNEYTVRTLESRHVSIEFKSI